MGDGHGSAPKDWQSEKNRSTQSLMRVLKVVFQWLAVKSTELFQLNKNVRLSFVNIEPDTTIPCRLPGLKLGNNARPTDQSSSIDLRVPKKRK
jgi:hypothetical protein